MQAACHTPDVVRQLERLGAWFDDVFAVCLGAALAVTVLACAPRPPVEEPDAGRPARVAVANDGRRCVARLPMTLRSPFGPQYAAILKRAARPWVAALHEGVVVDAGAGYATLTVTFAACPIRFVRADSSCVRWADTASWCVGGDLVQTIHVFAPASTEETELIFAHELGHALGVDSGGDEYGHSPDPRSVMYPTLSDKIDQTVTEFDAAAVRRAWGL